MSAAPALAPRKHILVVEDDLVANRALSRLLAEQYDVSVAFDGLEGLHAALKEPWPDLIITDVTMPRMDGVTMVKQIRARAKHKCPVIFLTAHGEPASVIAGISAGARNYLVKPVDVEDLETRIKRALGV